MHSRQTALFGSKTTQLVALASTLLLLCQPPGFAASAVETKSAEKAIPLNIVGRKVADFMLKNQAGEDVALSDFRDRKAVVLFFMGLGCPIANLYAPELMELQKKYESFGVQVIGIQSNAGVTAEDVAKHVEEFKITFPVLHDADQRIAQRLGATRMAEVFLLDGSRAVRYHGRIDDRFGYTYKRDTPRRPDLLRALKSVLDGKQVAVAETAPIGCLFTKPKIEVNKSNVTYAKHISRIVAERCHECHRPKLVAPFPLLTFDDVVKNSSMIKEVVVERRMPPWHADPRYGHFSNNRRMTGKEVDQLVAWINAGMPFGDEADLPPDPDYTDGWVIGEPDVILELPEEVTIPATGVVEYQHFSIPTNFEEDVWVTAAECQPGNRAVVHHIIAFYREPNGSREEIFNNWICSTAPGDPPLILPKGVGRRIPAGSQLVVQVHYTPTGKVEKDRSRVGLILHKGPNPPKRNARTALIINDHFTIPAGAADHRVDASFTFPANATLLTMMPHMHLRGKDFLVRATFPDGRKQTLLSVPAYDFNWQNSYRFTDPLEIPKGTRIDCIAHFDNSADNPANPDPTATVRWGDQTWEEMMLGYMNVVWEAGDGSFERKQKRRKRRRSE